MTATAFFFLIILFAGLGFAVVAPFLAIIFLIRLTAAWKSLRHDTHLTSTELLRQLAQQVFALHPISPALHSIPTAQK
ncbi:MAG: hypothetical protein H6R18_2178 [Proteobacteria bacterium]|nr:hypothetical protein [Pseudomonadota bacterium]